jgi:hypothetical protein
MGIFSMASDNSMCPGSTQPLKMSTRIFLGVKAVGGSPVTTNPIYIYPSPQSIYRETSKSLHVRLTITWLDLKPRSPKYKEAGGVTTALVFGNISIKVSCH